MAQHLSISEFRFSAAGAPNEGTTVESPGLQGFDALWDHEPMMVGRHSVKPRFILEQIKRKKKAQWKQRRILKPRVSRSPFYAGQTIQGQVRAPQSVAPPILERFMERTKDVPNHLSSFGRCRRSASSRSKITFLSEPHRYASSALWVRRGRIYPVVC